jgi:hypothetical protein
VSFRPELNSDRGLLQLRNITRITPVVSQSEVLKGRSGVHE